ncbi:TRAP transporter large permease [Basilea psittacipulmonis]|uniref:C4-dicarboxylate ABC transporter n=1 Tax=Basilea psittacipulmonis DSM 24701 TaxID=1072685 RepID=A0A077DHB6_9BURK|nr:TRAP transporter large permease subunit [Basilea psittacipulmonis]AIL32887.1 C4-dicarboxylate ABC transporter [Basilea psittacipulmonis DSM 24701]
MDFILNNMPPIMFVTLIGLLLMGFPVAFSLAANGLLYCFLGIATGAFSFAFLQALPERIFGIVANDSLLAVPFFTLMGLVLERSKMAEDLLETIGQIFGSLRGGLAIAVVIVGAMLAATTGVVSASVISMGLISLPIMLRYQYNRSIATGVIAASGALSQIIPPSLVLIVLADQVGTSVGNMYRGAMLPGLMLAGAYILYIIFNAIFRPTTVPALPDEHRIYQEPNGSRGVRSLGVLTLVSAVVAYFLDKWLMDSSAPLDQRVVTSLLLWGIVAFVFALLNRFLKLGFLSKLAERSVFVMIPPLFLIFLVLGTIFIGIATPTEGGAMGAVGAIILATLRKRLNFDLLQQAMSTTARITSFCMFILVGSTIFTLTFTGFGGQVWVEHLFSSLPGGVYGFLIVVSIVIFFLAFFLDFFELAFIVVPLLAPVAQSMGIDLVWFGILIAINMQTSFIHPPFGFALFYLRSVAPKADYIDSVTGKLIKRISTGDIYKGAIAFIVIQLLMVLIVMFIPSVVTHYKDDAPKIDPNTIQIEQPVNDYNTDAGDFF